MSDMQMPQGQPPAGGVKDKMSMFNPTDLAAKTATGDISPDMTVGEFLQRNFGVSPDDPVQKLVQATKQQLQTRTMAGKLGMPQGQPPGAGAPPMRPSPSGGSFDDLINKMR